MAVPQGTSRLSLLAPRTFGRRDNDESAFVSVKSACDDVESVLDAFKKVKLSQQSS